MPCRIAIGDDLRRSFPTILATRFFRLDSAAVLLGPPGSLVIDEGNRSDLKCMGPMIRRRERLKASGHSIFALLADTSSKQTMTLFVSISK
jgi:hypothetical protein